MSPPNLESLPLDVAYNILSQLYQGPATKEHPFLILSAQSKTLNSLVEAYSAHLLATRRARFPKAKNTPVQKGTNRQKLLYQIGTYCEFCNKKSSRKAILARDLVCCKKCDQDEWPTKITKTDACKRYHLKQQDLFSAGIRYGQYFGVTGLTTLFLEHEVREVATRVHAGPGGDLGVYLALCASQSVKRKAKQEEAREAKKAHLRRVLIANGLPDPTLVARLSPLLFPAHNQRPAMSVLEVVRAMVLEHRLQTELGYRQQNNGPGPTSSYVAWEQARLWDTRVVDDMPCTIAYIIAGQDRRNINDPRDRALFELFCKEFGLHPDHHQENAIEGEGEEELLQTALVKEKREASYQMLYKEHRRTWASVSDMKRTLEMPRQATIASGRRPRWEATVMRAQAPWSWARYPILVKDAVAEDPAPAVTKATTTAAEAEAETQSDISKEAEKEKERKKVTKWNAGAEKEMSRITALIKERGLGIEKWCKLGDPQYGVEEVEAAGTLQVLREGGGKLSFLIDRVP